ncbi:MAG: imidazolonepropionase [Treponema sp.]|jgi:imidazolonepropionase|nr:imidazolonepropionase [Treponema sp.]
MSGNLLVYNIGCMATPEGKQQKKGNKQGEITIRNNCHILVKNGIIVEIGDNPPGIELKYKDCEKLDAMNALVTPGLVDCHTHLVFGGWRHGELELKLKGASYLEILAAGGGILSTVEKTREAGVDGLYKKAYRLLDECLSFGVTTLEAKSGYGLDTENEIKCLDVIKKLNAEHQMDLVSTFMGAHAIPKEHRESRKEYVSLVCDEMLPVVAEKRLAAFCDVFCENGAFSPDESRHILAKAKSLGMKLKIHAEEINNLGGALLAAELACTSAEHLIKIDEAGIKALTESGTVAVCLPCTSFYLNEGFAPAREMINQGVPVAIATDFNPGSSPNLNLQLAMSMACYRYKMTPKEVLTAVTLNAAAAIGKEAEAGSLETGKTGDIVLWDSGDLDYIFYRYGSNLVKTVVKNGTIVKGAAKCC